MQMVGDKCFYLRGWTSRSWRLKTGLIHQNPGQGVAGDGDTNTEYGPRANNCADGSHFDERGGHYFVSHFQTPPDVGRSSSRRSAIGGRNHLAIGSEQKWGKFAKSCEKKFAKCVIEGKEFEWRQNRNSRIRKFPHPLKRNSEFPIHSINWSRLWRKNRCKVFWNTAYPENRYLTYGFWGFLPNFKMYGHRSTPPESESPESPEREPPCP